MSISLNSVLNRQKQPMRMLLLGDSIRMGYQPLVMDMLADLAKVVGPEDNCEDSRYHDNLRGVCARLRMTGARRMSSPTTRRRWR
ncbi:MAG: hypothetical protein LUO80_08970 [Methylococcaceae bacterium]|nr:hypothetical protein [Methylococcaceae bacterium]